MSISMQNADMAQQLLPQQVPPRQEQAAQQQTQQLTDQSGFGPAAVFEPSGAQTQSRFAPDTATLHQLSSATNSRTMQLVTLSQQLFGGQANTLEAAARMISGAGASGNLTNIDPSTVAQAQADIAEDGFFGVEAVADRIVSFSQALSGGNPAQLQNMRQAVERGFAAAERAWGRELPEISQQTLEAVRAEFDALESQVRGVSASIG